VCAYGLAGDGKPFADLVVGEPIGCVGGDQVEVDDRAVRGAEQHQLESTQ
jgi:hypothetical protein